MKWFRMTVVALGATTLAFVSSAASAPASTPPASSPSPTSSPSANVTSTDVSIPSRGIQIPATVVAPAGDAAQQRPLVVIHHGHGGGRNENGGLARVATALAEAGIISIRFDFAGAGDSTEPFTALSYTTMLADSNAVLTWAVRNLPVDKERIGGFGYSEGSAVVAIEAGQPFTAYQAVALLGPVANPTEVFKGFFGDKFDAYEAEAMKNGFAVVTTPFGQTQQSSHEWFVETRSVDPVGELSHFDGAVELIWGDKEQVIPASQVDAFKAATKQPPTVVTIAEADHGYGFYSDQPDVDAALHDALVTFFTEQLGA